jgi:hypothetical protein
MELSGCKGTTKNGFEPHWIGIPALRNASAMSGPAIGSVQYRNSGESEKPKNFVSSSLCITPTSSPACQRLIEMSWPNLYASGSLVRIMPRRGIFFPDNAETMLDTCSGFICRCWMLERNRPSSNSASAVFVRAVSASAERRDASFVSWAIFNSRASSICFDRGAATLAAIKPIASDAITPTSAQNLITSIYHACPVKRERCAE